MIWRWLLSALVLAASYGAFLIMDCASFTISMPAQGSSSFVCVGSDSAGMAPGLGTAVLIWAASAAALIGVWAPMLSAGRRKAERAVASLSENIARVAKPERGSAEEMAVEPVTPDDVNTQEPPEQTELEVVRQKLSRLEELAASGSMPPRDWLSLLVEINGLHNEGVMSTETFKEINTELISLVAEPMARVEQPALNAS